MFIFVQSNGRSNKYPYRFHPCYYPTPSRSRTDRATRHTSRQAQHPRPRCVPCQRIPNRTTDYRVQPSLRWTRSTKGRRRGRGCLKRPRSCLRKQSTALPVPVLSLSRSRPPWMLLVLLKTRAAPAGAGPHFPRILSPAAAGAPSCRLR